MFSTLAILRGLLVRTVPEVTNAHSVAILATLSKHEKQTSGMGASTTPTSFSVSSVVELSEQGSTVARWGFT